MSWFIGEFAPDGRYLPSLIEPQRTRSARSLEELKAPGEGLFMIFSVTSVFSMVQILSGRPDKSGPASADGTQIPNTYSVRQFVAAGKQFELVE
jgi:hypothetical protein